MIDTFVLSIEFTCIGKKREKALKALYMDGPPYVHMYTCISSLSMYNI